MSAEIQLDPITRAQLHTFGKRRAKLIVLRGLCATAATLVIGLSVLALLDWLVLMPDGLRWALGICVYLVAAGVAWGSCVRLLLLPPSDHQLARLLEQVQPELREELLSAVELGSGGDASLDSPEFRTLLQRSVATKMQGVQVRASLPLKRLKPWLIGAAAVAAACGVLLLLPGLNFGKRIMRAGLPLAHIARVSTVQIDIVEPAPNSRYVPLGDSVPVIATVSTRNVKRAVLETYHPQTGSAQTVMTLRDNGSFAGEIAMASDALEYRVIAGDAVTEWHALKPHTTPYAKAFEKKYTYPDYTALAAVTRSESDGALTALQGTQVELIIETDQPSTGELRIEQGKNPPLSARLTTVTPTRLRGTIPVEASGQYQVLLIAEKTGLANKFSPRYEIKAQPDLAPKVELHQPQANQLLQPDELVTLSGTAEDDFALARVEQWVQVNGADEWLRFPLLEKPGKQTPVAGKWDVLKLNLHAGDLVTTKLVAIDSKGNQGESTILQLAVNFQELNPDRLAALNAKRAVMALLQQANTSAEQQVKALSEHVTDAMQERGDDAKLRETATEAKQLLGKLEDEHRAAFYQVNQVLQRMPKGADVYDLTQIGRVFAGTVHESLDSVRRRFDLALTLKDPAQRSTLLNPSRSELDTLRRRLRNAEQHYRDMLAGETLAVALTDLHALAREQARLVRDDDDAPQEQMALRRMGRVLGMIATQFTQTEALLASLDKKQFEKDSRKFEQLAAEMKALHADADSALAAVMQNEKENGGAKATLGTWQVLGPLEVTDYSQAYDQQMDPERRIDLVKGMGALKWTARPDFADGHVHVLSEEKQNAFYLYRTIQSLAAQTLECWFSSNEGIKAWNNGDLVLENKPYRYIKPDMDKRLVQITPGQNNLLVKIVSSRLSPAFCFRTDGASVVDLAQQLRTPVERLKAASRKYRLAINGSIALCAPTLSELSRRVSDSREKLTQTAESLSIRVDKLSSARQNAFKSVRGGFEQNTDKYADFAARHLPVISSFLRDCGTVGEIRPDADSRFVADTGQASRGLNAVALELRDAAAADAHAKSERIRTIASAYRVLETVHNVVEVTGIVSELASLERWSGQSARAMTRHPQQWEFAVRRMQAVAQQIEGAGLPKAAALKIGQIADQAHGKQISAEMDQRSSRRLDSVSMTKQMQTVADDLAAVLALLEPNAEQARRLMDGSTPKLKELMQLAAQKAKQLDEATRKAAAKEAVKDAQAAEFRAEQRSIQALTARIVDALREDANIKDQLTRESRERARDNDDAIAMLRQNASRADVQYGEAVRADAAERRTQQLEHGAEEEGKLAVTLTKLAEHYDKLDAGKPEQVAETREELRKAEAELEMKDDLDRQFAQTERLAALAELAREQSPEKLAQALKGELKKNEGMQKELHQMAANTAREALRNLEVAADNEKTAAEKLGDAAVAAGEADEELKAQLAALQKQIEDLSQSQVPELARAAVAEKLSRPTENLAAAQKQTRDAAEKRPSTLDKKSVDSLAAQAAALEKAATDLAEAALVSEQETAARHAAEIRANDPVAQLGDLQAQIEKLMAEQLPDAALAAEKAGVAAAQVPFGEAQLKVEAAAKSALPAMREKLLAQADALRAAAAPLNSAVALTKDEAAKREAGVKEELPKLAARVEAERLDAAQKTMEMQALAAAHQAAVERSKANPKDAAAKADADAAWPKFKAARTAAQMADKVLKAAEEQLANPTRQTDLAATLAANVAEKARELAHTASQMAAMDSSASAAPKNAVAQPASDTAAKAAAAQKKAAKLATSAKALSEKIAKSGTATDPKMALSEAATTQRNVAGQVAASGESLRRAAAHQEQLGAKKESEAFKKVATQIEKLASGDVADAGKVAASAQKATTAKAAVSKAEQSIRVQAGNLEKALFPSVAQNEKRGGGAAEAGPQTAEEHEVSVQLARALDLAAVESAKSEAASAPKNSSGSGTSDKASGSEGAAKDAAAAQAAKSSSGSGLSDKASGSEGAAKDAAAAQAAKSGSGSGLSDKASGSEGAAKDAAAAQAAKSGSGSGLSDKASGSEGAAKDAAAAQAAKSGSGSGLSDKASGSEGAAKDAAAAQAAKSGSGSGLSDKASGSEGAAKDAAAAQAAKSGSGSGLSDKASGSEGAAKDAAAVQAAKSGSGSGLSDKASGSEGAAKDAAAAQAAKSGSGSGMSDKASGSEGAAKNAAAAQAAKSGSGSGSGGASGSSENATAAAKSGSGKGSKGSMDGSDAPPATVGPTVQAAAKANARAMAALRTVRSTEAPGGPVENEATIVTGLSDMETQRKRKEWGALKAQQAKYVADGELEPVAEEYRGSVEMYFRALAKQAREEAAK